MLKPLLKAYYRKEVVEQNRIIKIIINSVLTGQKLIYKQYCNSNTQTVKVIMKLELCIILKLLLNFSDSET